MAKSCRIKSLHKTLRRLLMLYHDCIEKLLQLKDVIVTNIEKHENEMHIHLKMAQRLHYCPACGKITSKVHDYRSQIVKDVSMRLPYDPSSEKAPPCLPLLRQAIR